MRGSQMFERGTPGPVPGKSGGEPRFYLDPTKCQFTVIPFLGTYPYRVIKWSEKGSAKSVGEAQSHRGRSSRIF
jgi:hypothetical protein